MKGGVPGGESVRNRYARWIEVEPDTTPSKLISAIIGKLLEEEEKEQEEEKKGDKERKR